MARSGVAVPRSHLPRNIIVIFVTVGTTLHFDSLVQFVDELVECGELTEQVICQIGNGAYVPKHCEYFRFMPDLDVYIASASLIIGHGGTGTVTGLLASGKPFIAVANPLGAGNHQAQFLERLNEHVSFLWTADLERLPDLIGKVGSFVPCATKGACLADNLRAFLSGAESVQWI